MPKTTTTKTNATKAGKAKGGKRQQAKANGTSPAKRKQVKAQATKATKAAKAKAQPLKMTQAQLREVLAKLVSTKPDAPKRHLVFVQSGRVQVRLERVAEALSTKENPVGVGQVRKLLVEGHGFKRQPFSFADKTVAKGQNSASYFWSDKAGLVKGLPERDRPQATKAGK